MSYDMIDRFLRNNLHDEDYAEFSAALDAVIADAAAAHAQGLRERIAELEAQRVPQWISVDDRLPEKFIEVLICFAGQSTLCATGQYTDNHRHDVAGWCYPAENRGCTDSGDDPVVTHWMPLPPPPVERAHGIEGGETHNARLSGDQQP